MDPKWIQVLVILLLRQRVASAAQVKAGEEVSIRCRPPSAGTMVVWFRVLDGSGMEFIASSSSSGHIKQPGTNFHELFRLSDSTTLTLRSFSRGDGGIYSCASLVSGSRLDFGDVTKLQLSEEGTKSATGAPAPQPTTQTSTPASTCRCTEKTEPSMFCAPIILAPLAGGCGLLLLLLIVTSVYCNKIRTRRCPHHYKRKPRSDALEKQMMTNRHG